MSMKRNHSISKGSKYQNLKCLRGAIKFMTSQTKLTASNIAVSLEYMEATSLLYMYMADFSKENAICSRKMSKVHQKCNACHAYACLLQAGS